LALVSALGFGPRASVGVCTERTTANVGRGWAREKRLLFCCFLRRDLFCVASARSNRHLSCEEEEEIRDRRGERVPRALEETCAKAKRLWRWRRGRLVRRHQIHTCSRHRWRYAHLLHSTSSSIPHQSDDPSSLHHLPLACTATT
jgi:hypothetical protein